MLYPDCQNKKIIKQKADWQPRSPEKHVGVWARSSHLLDSVNMNLFPHSYDLYLVGGIPTPLKKYDNQLGSLFPIYGKIKNMFQTTNQIEFDG